MSRKIAIVAKGGTSALAPWGDESWEVWGLPWIWYPRASRLFEIHTQACADEAEGDFGTGGWLEEYRRRQPDVPVWCVPSRAHLFRNPVDYPMDAVLAFLPIPYLENSIAYQLALALYEHSQGETVEEIGLYGVHMTGMTEYVAERPSVAYLVGLAQGMGIKVSVAPGSPLFLSAWTQGRYGLSCEQRQLHS